MKQPLTREQEAAAADFLWNNIEKDMMPSVTRKDFVQHIYRYMSDINWEYGRKEDLVDLNSATIITETL